ncbi:MULTISPECIES: flagellar assembly protein FliW [unclassified Cryobacterium]|uniref:flagellar assembly protein FliW n=1 Tax=unclassified Cryobacterium TaxID=2649013 RepID=UPI001F546306
MCITPRPVSATLTLVSPPPGLDSLTEFDFTEITGADGLYTLQSADDRQTRLFVLDAVIYLPDYSPVITDDHAHSLDLAGPEDALVLVVTNPRQGGTTVNLMVPIVVNPATERCAQIILEGQS